MFVFGWRFLGDGSTLHTAATSVYLHVYHLADSVEQLGAIFQILLGFVGLVSAAVLPYIFVRLTHSFRFISFTYGVVVSFKVSVNKWRCRRVLLFLYGVMKRVIISVLSQTANYLHLSTDCTLALVLFSLGVANLRINSTAYSVIIGQNSVIIGQNDVRTIVLIGH